MDKVLELRLRNLQVALQNLSEFDGDASWYKDNSKQINELVKAAYEVEDWYVTSIETDTQQAFDANPELQARIDHSIKHPETWVASGRPQRKTDT